MDYDRFEEQLKTIKDNPEQYFTLDHSYGSIRFVWDKYNNMYQIVNAIGTVSFFSDYTIIKDENLIKFYRWIKTVNKDGNEKYVQCVTVLLVVNDVDPQILSELIKRDVKE